jgi:hypothetical protein
MLLAIDSSQASSKATSMISRARPNYTISIRQSLIAKLGGFEKAQLTFSPRRACFTTPSTNGSSLMTKKGKLGHFTLIQPPAI